MFILKGKKEINQNKQNQDKENFKTLYNSNIL